MALMLATLVGQPPDALGPVKRTNIPAGDSTKRISLTLRDRPAIDDRFIVTLSTKQLGVVLITPQGQRVTKENSEASGYSWSDLDFQPAIGSTDGGQSVAITFAKAGEAGSYGLEVTGRGLASSAWAQGSFASTKREYAEVMRALNGVNGLKTAGPVALTKRKPSVELALNLTAEDRAAFFDIVITNDASTVWMVLPDAMTLSGVIRRESAEERRDRDRRITSDRDV
jgi:hypothetical protein